MKPLLWLGLLVLLVSYPMGGAYGQASPFTGMGEGDGSIVSEFDVGARTVGPPSGGTVRGAAIAGDEDDIISGQRRRPQPRANVRRPRPAAPEVSATPARPPARAARTKQKKSKKAADTDVMPVKPATAAAGAETPPDNKFRWGKSEPVSPDAEPRFHWGKRGEPIE